MEKVAAAKFEFFFELGDDLFEAVGGEGSGIEEGEGEFADDVASGVAGQDGVSFRGLQGVGSIVGKDEMEKLLEASAVGSEMTKKRGRAVAEDEMPGGRVGGEPRTFAKDGKNVFAGEGIDVSAVLSDVFFGGHGSSLARTREGSEREARLSVGAGRQAGCR